MKIKIGNKTFDISKEDLEKDEVTLPFEGTLRTTEEEETYYNNIKTDLHKAGEELAVKGYREEFGFEGRSIDKLIEAVKNKTLADAKIEPAEQLKKIKATLEEKETALQSALGKINEKDNEFKSYKNQNTLDSFLDSQIPDKTLLPREDMKLILKSKLKFDIDDNGNILPLDASGNVIKDPTTANPRKANEIVESFFKDNQGYLKPIEGGSGEGDSADKGSKKTLDKFIEEQTASGVKINSEEFNTALKTQVDAGLVDVD